MTRPEFLQRLDGICRLISDLSRTHRKDKKLAALDDDLRHFTVAARNVEGFEDVTVVGELGGFYRIVKRPALMGYWFGAESRLTDPHDGHTIGWAYCELPFLIVQKLGELMQKELALKESN